MTGSKAAIGGVLSKKLLLFRNIQKKTSDLESLFNKFAGLGVCNFIKKRLQLSCFSLYIEKFLRTPVLKTSGNGYLSGSLNPLHVSFYSSWKHQKMRASGIFSGCTKRPMAQNALIRHCIEAK